MEAESLREPEDRAVLCIMMPVFNDWTVAFALLAQVDATLAGHGLRADVVLVDDGSTVQPEPPAKSWDFGAVRNVSVLRLRRNLGHQRAIAIGMAHIHDHRAYDVVCVMDADGEDAPSDIPRLLDALRASGGDRIVFAERARRSESRLFQLFYWLYRVVHVTLTGHRVRFGNFSVLPWRRLENLGAVSETWNHYVAAVIAAKLPYESVPAKRAARIGGQSKMGFQSLVIHGLRALSVFSDTIGLRLMLTALVVAVLVTGCVLGMAVFNVFADVAAPPWVLQMAVVVLILLGQSLLFILLFVFVMLANRSGTSFLPCRDYVHFVAESTTLHSTERGKDSSLVPQARAESSERS